jgi:hypothetical protein
MTSSGLATTTAVFLGALATTLNLGSDLGKFFPHFGDFLEAHWDYVGIFIFHSFLQGTLMRPRVNQSHFSVGKPCENEFSVRAA